MIGHLQSFATGALLAAGLPALAWAAGTAAAAEPSASSAPAPAPTAPACAPGAAGESSAPGAAHLVVDLPAIVLERYVGYYALPERAVLAVTRQGSQLFAELPGAAAAPICPQTLASFIFGGAAGRIDFLTDDQGLVNALVLHRDGEDRLAARIDAAQAQRLAARP
jgi:hypothetical protein